MSYPSQLEAELWTPARYISMSQICWFCHAHIPRDRPGARVGDRGTKAFFNSARRLWECTPCRVEATRAFLVCQQPHAPVVEICEACRYQRLDTDSPTERPIFRLVPCAGCELGAGRGLHRTCPRCTHVEHRSHVTAVAPLEGAA
mgnify:CR=1 FL=1